MLLREERELLVSYAQRLRPDGLALLTAGNLSVRAGDLAAITPTTLDYDALTPELICVIELGGEVVEAELPPSSELPMHLAVYRHVPTAAAIVHTHAPYSTVLSTVVAELPAVHYLVAELGGPVRVAPYETFGTAELAEVTALALEGRSAALLANHGTIAYGDSLERAYARTILLEWLATLYYRARVLGEPRLLPTDEIERVARKLSLAGSGGLPHGERT